MNTSLVGAAAGAVLALTWLTFGFWACVFVALAMLVGVGVGRVLDGRLDLRALGEVFRGRRRSS
ncbi:DUF2273 domain-containing protein [uncultured Microbacterium sp.]|uniref:DUF2273 domain-containing protein n=1 Tax=uncultured Microbacterium sp. TaxID=191216 RepID=UPI0025CCEE1D|nr:DUF2273 domain-containing protein [uncultured Microbacterium sp.]